MKYTSLKNINEYKSEIINPTKSPDMIFEMYSVPIFETGHPEYLRGCEIGSSKALVQKNDVLLCKINPRINRVWVVSDESIHPNIASSEWIVVRNKEYNPEFLAWYFRSPKFKRLMTSEVTGIGGSLTRAQPKTVAKYPVPVLPRQAQDNITCVLNTVNGIFLSRKQEIQKLETLIKARFVEMFGDPESNEKYPQIAIKDFTNVISGGTPDRKNDLYWKNGTVPWVKTTELQNKRIDIVEEYITEKGLNESSAKIVPEDTVLVAMYGQGKTRGMTAILGIPAATNQACACILPSERVEATYLWQYMIMSYDRLRNLAQGGNQPNLNGNMIKNFTVLVPPKDFQSQFVDFVTQVDKSKIAVQKSLDETQLLFDSLMQQYFG